MPLSFPSSPTTNQTATINGRTYRWTGSVWEFVSSGGSSGLTWSSVPASATASGTAGQIAYDGSYYYVCTAANTWKRTAIAAWGLDEYFSSVSLLLHMNGSGSTFTDSSPTPKTITAYGDVTQSTTQSKFGGKSAYFDGTGDYLTVPNSSAFDLAGSDWVVEMWIYLLSNSTAQGLVEQFTPTGGPGWTLYASAAGGLQIYTGSQSIDFGVQVSANAWHYVAMSRSGGIISTYFNGNRTQQATANFSTSTDNPLRIGNLNGNSFLNGYIDELRITKGGNRPADYTGATIPVPTAPFPDA